MRVQNRERLPPVVIHVPHSATTIPADVRSQFVVNDRELQQELLVTTDHLTDRLFAVPKDIGVVVRYGFSRLVVDPERFRSDDEEIMAAVGMGAVYTAGSRGSPLRRALTACEQESLLRRFYDPHHSALTQAVAAALRAHNFCLVIDVHSFPSRPLPYERDQHETRPVICIGTDAFHTPAWLRDGALQAFAGAGGLEPPGPVLVNRPFSGALVPRPFYHRDRRVFALMIEINRRLYLDEATGRASAGFGPARKYVWECVNNIVNLCSDAAGSTKASVFAAGEVFYKMFHETPAGGRSSCRDKGCE